MNLSELKEKPLWQMTGAEFLFLQEAGINSLPISEPKAKSEYAYGIAGIAKLFGCSIPTANRIKASGKIDKAIKQIGRKIIVDTDLALELAGKKEGGRK